MKYVISWNERPQGSPAEYETAQKRILEVFGQWKAPENFKIEFFVARVGDWGGHLLVDCDGSPDGSQVLLDAPRVCHGGAPGGSRHGRRPGRTRSHGLARQNNGQVTSGTTLRLSKWRGSVPECACLHSH